MKKTFLSLMMAGAILFSISLTSCKQSNQDLIDDYRNVSKEMVEAIKSQDEAKVKEISDKGSKIVDELKNRDLTEEEQKEVADITAEMLTGAYQSAMDAAASEVQGEE